MVYQDLLIWREYCEGKKISVIVATYNVEQYIERCMNSVINQTQNEFELIVVNDGSTDNTLKVINSIAKHDKRIIVINQQNRGVMCARNEGVKIATGEYILFVDGDDWIKNNTIEILYKSLEENRTDIVLFNVFWQFDNGNIKYVNSFDKNYIEASNDYIDMLLLGKISENIWNKLIKRELLLNLNLKNDLIYGEDLVTVLKLLINKPRISYIEDNLYYYYQRSTSITKVLDERVFNLEKSISTTKEMLCENGIYEKYKKQYEYLCYRTIFLPKIVFNIEFNNIHKVLYYNFKDRKINIKNNQYILAHINNQDFIVRSKIKIYISNYKFVNIYKGLRKVFKRSLI